MTATRAAAGPHVLLVEDDVIVARLTTHHLELDGYRVTHAASAAEALAVVARCPELDLVLLDHGLPDLDGVEAARRLREQAPVAGLPIVWLTGDPTLVAHPGAEAVDAVAVKPLTGAELRALVAAHTGVRPTR